MEREWHVLLSPAERTMVAVLREAPGGAMTREDFERSSVARGLNPNTFSVLTSYSPFIKELGGSIWTVRGAEPDPVEVERLRRAVRPHGRQIEGWEWMPSGDLRLSVRLRSVNTVVVGIPSAIQSYLSGRAFDALLDDQSRVGSVRVDEDGASWGYGPALRSLKAAPDDLMLIDFNLPASTATIRALR
jgi:hypothetical protein